ncbi:hypothetical protein V500_10256 [Pseudogymnoascus sp. VKM F-4518 (FW-2643)]|nr:hypothetical protein V500_10256 [Pseudogymnoascus sp. VKM F-4518 (FW-2643)]
MTLLVLYAGITVDPSTLQPQKLGRETSIAGLGGGHLFSHVISFASIFTCDNDCIPGGYPSIANASPTRRIAIPTIGWRLPLTYHERRRHPGAESTIHALGPIRALKHERPRHGYQVCAPGREAVATPPGCRGDERWSRGRGDGVDYPPRPGDYHGGWGEVAWGAIGGGA